MNTYKILSIDESGKASYSHLSKYFILCGVIIEESRKKKVAQSQSKIKNKFFGRVIVESDTHQDFFLLKAHHFHQASSPSYRAHVTSLSYVTKGNQDPDVEIADSIALISRFYFESKSTNDALTRIQKMKTSFVKRKIASKINPSYLIRLKIQ